MLSTYTQNSMNTIDQHHMFTNAVNNNQFIYMQNNSNGGMNSSQGYIAIFKYYKINTVNP
jgi:hypothetical protein